VHGPPWLLLWPNKKVFWFVLRLNIRSVTSDSLHKVCRDHDMNLLQDCTRVMTHGRNINPLVWIRGHLLVICSQLCPLRTRVVDIKESYITHRLDCRCVYKYTIPYVCGEGCRWRKYPTHKSFNAITEDLRYCMINTRNPYPQNVKSNICWFYLIIWSLPAHVYVRVLVHRAELTPF